MSVRTRRTFISLALFVVLAAGCGRHKDPAVQKEIQARYDQQDAAFSSHDVIGVTALCTPDYSETNAGIVSARPRSADSVSISLKGHVHIQENRQKIGSLAEYRDFLPAYFAAA